MILSMDTIAAAAKVLLETDVKREGFKTVICIVHVLCSDTNFMKVVCQAETQ